MKFDSFPFFFLQLCSFFCFVKKARRNSWDVGPIWFLPMASFKRIRIDRTKSLWAVGTKVREKSNFFGWNFLILKVRMYESARVVATLVEMREMVKLWRCFRSKENTNDELKRFYLFLQAYKVVENWPTKNLDPLMTALELLDVDYPDPFVRFSAVRLLDTRIDDDRLLPVILQLVQVGKK